MGTIEYSIVYNVSYCARRLIELQIKDCFLKFSFANYCRKGTLRKQTIKSSSNYRERSHLVYKKFEF